MLRSKSLKCGTHKNAASNKTEQKAMRHSYRHINQLGKFSSIKETRGYRDSQDDSVLTDNMISRLISCDKGQISCLLSGTAAGMLPTHSFSLVARQKSRLVKKKG
jgi:hypothetical protein